MGIIPERLTGFFFLVYILFFYFKYEAIVRSSALSFDHSDPNPSSVNRSYRCLWPKLFASGHEALDEIQKDITDPQQPAK